MPQLTKPIFTALFLALAAGSAHADALRGFVQKKAGVRILVVQNDDGSQSQLQISTSTTQVQADINKLKSGDFLVARGSVANLTVQIDAIESLGLQALVGSWGTTTTDIYEFQDFTHLNLYASNADHSQIVKTNEFQYSVAPDQGSRYSIFMSNTGGSVTVGSIEFKKRHLVLNTIDPTNGKVSADIVLSPLASLPH
jgi:hypothetical protein